MTEINRLREELTAFLGFQSPPEIPTVRTLCQWEEESYTRFLIEYNSSDGDIIEAFLLVPRVKVPFPECSPFISMPVSGRSERAKSADSQEIPIKRSGRHLLGEGSVYWLLMLSALNREWPPVARRVRTDAGYKTERESSFHR